MASKSKLSARLHQQRIRNAAKINPRKNPEKSRNKTSESENSITKVKHTQKKNRFDKFINN